MSAVDVGYPVAQLGGHPLAVSVNRDDHISAVVPASLSLRRDAESVLPRSGVKGGLPHLGSPAKRTLDAAQRPRRCRMAACAAFERLQPWSAYWLALRARTDSAPRLLLLLSPDFKARKPVALAPSELLAHLVLEHWLRRCAPVTHQDQGRHALRRVAPGCFCSPRKPSVPHRVQLRQPSEPAAQFFGFTEWRSNPLWLTVRAQRTLQPGRDRRRRAISFDGSANPHMTLPAPSH
jgi:hypothetical protein